MVRCRVRVKRAMSLEPIDPEQVLELYPADRENAVTRDTLFSHRSRLSHFPRRCNGTRTIAAIEISSVTLINYHAGIR